MKYHVQGYKDYKEAFFAFPFFEDNEKKKKKSIALFFITFLKKSDLITAYNNYYQGLVLHFSECIDLSAFLFPLPISYLYSVLRKEKKKMYSFFFFDLFFSFASLGKLYLEYYFVLPSLQIRQMRSNCPPHSPQHTKANNESSACVSVPIRVQNVKD